MARGGRREGAGRPAGTKLPAEAALSEQVAVRLTPDEKRRLSEIAAAEGMTISRYIHKLLFGRS